MPAFIALVSLTGILMAGCSHDPSDTLTAPAEGTCRVLAIADLSARTNNSSAVDCSQPHTAQTIKVATFPTTVGSDYHADPVGAFAYQTCTEAFAASLGAADSVAPRAQLSWAWFGPTDDAWRRGARWFRCDAVGAPPDQSSMADIPADLTNLLAGFPPDHWLTCATGSAFTSRVNVACDQPHTWRAVTAVKLGQPKDPYPGDHISAVRAHNYCSDAVGAYLNYANTYEFGYTTFHRAEWKAGNRRAVCWAKTTK